MSGGWGRVRRGRGGLGWEGGGGRLRIGGGFLSLSRQHARRPRRFQRPRHGAYLRHASHVTAHPTLLGTKISTPTHFIQVPLPTKSTAAPRISCPLS
eukprot:748802-Hanusia_phi.AAC.6